MSAHIVSDTAFRFGAQDSIAARSAALIAESGQPLAEVIRWLSPVSSHVILGKDGSLMACMDFDGLDLDSSSGSEINQIRSQLVYALEQLQEKAPVLTWHVRRRRTEVYPECEFPDEVSRTMDDLQRESFLKNVQYINRHSLCLNLSPNAQASRILARMGRAQERSGMWEAAKSLLSGVGGAIKGEVEFPYQDATEISVALEQFERDLDVFIASVSSLNVRILRDDVLGGFLQLCASPTSAIEELADLPNDQNFMDTTMPVGDVDNSNSDMLGFTHNGKQVWTSCYSLDLRKRENLSVDMLDTLMAAPFEFTLTHVYKMLPRARGERAVGEAHAYHSARRFNLKSILVAAFNKGDLSAAPVNESRDVSAAEALALKDQVGSGRTGVGLYYGTVMVQADTPEQCLEARKEAEALLQAAKLLPRLETLHKFSSYCATIPGSHDEVARWVKIESVNFADMCPIRTVASGSLTNNYLTEQLEQKCHALIALPTGHRTPFYYSGYVGDVGHELVIGPTGTGKTALSTLLWSQFRKYPGARVIVFDKNYSSRPAVMLQGGTYIDLNPERQADKQFRMSPLAALLANGSLEHLSFLAQWIELLARIGGHNPTSEDRMQLERALRSTAEGGVDRPESLRLATVLVKLDMSSPLAVALRMWTGDAAYATYFDNESDDLNLDSLVGVEMGNILTNEELAAPFMSYAFYRINAMLRSLGAGTKPVPTLIYVPEAWYFLQNKTFATELDEWLVTLRKLGARVCFDTQNPDKLVKSSVFPAFRDNVPNLILTPNPKARTTSLQAMYRDELALYDYEIEYVISGIPKKDYVLRQGNLSRRISMQMSPGLVPYIRSDMKAQKVLERYIAQGLPVGWQADYIKELSHA